MPKSIHLAQSYNPHVLKRGNKLSEADGLRARLAKLLMLAELVERDESGSIASHDLLYNRLASDVVNLSSAKKAGEPIPA